MTISSESIISLAIQNSVSKRYRINNFVIGSCIGLALLIAFFTPFHPKPFQGVLLACFLLSLAAVSSFLRLAADDEKIFVDLFGFTNPKGSKLYFDDVVRFHCNSFMFIQMYDLIGTKTRRFFLNSVQDFRDLLQHILIRIPETAHVDEVIYKQAGMTKEEVRQAHVEWLKTRK